jgi:hypothetical protein
MQEKLEASVAGRAVISAALIVTLVAIGIFEMPVSVTKSYLVGPARGYLRFLGLNEGWGVFSPNPPRASAYTEGRINYADGTSSVWTVPNSLGPLAYVDYRWHNVGGWAGLDDHSQLWQPFAMYLANHESLPGRVPVQVLLTRRSSALSPPGVTPRSGPWLDQVYYVQPIVGPR